MQELKDTLSANKNIKSVFINSNGDHFFAEYLAKRSGLSYKEFSVADLAKLDEKPTVKETGDNKPKAEKVESKKDKAAREKAKAKATADAEALEAEKAAGSGDTGEITPGKESL